MTTQTTQDTRQDTTTGAPAMTLTVDAAELRRVVLAVEKSCARDDARPVLAGIQATVDGDRLTLAAADGFRLSTASATLDTPADADTSTIPECAGLLGCAKTLTR